MFLEECVFKSISCYNQHIPFCLTLPNCNLILKLTLKDCLCENRDGITNGKEQSTNLEDYCHFLTNLLLGLYEAGTFFVPSCLGEIPLKVVSRHDEGRIPAYLGQYFPYKFFTCVSH